MTDGRHPAFVVPDSDPVWAYGLTKREYFAAAAMQGMLANSSYDWSGEEEEASEQCLAYADSLIDALNEEPAK